MDEQNATVTDNSLSEFKTVIYTLDILGVDCGLHTKWEKRILWDLARAVYSGVIVEIGSYEGYSTIILAKGLGENGEVYAIDPHISRRGDTWLRFNDNIRRAGVAHIIKAKKMKSEEAAEGWDKPVGLLFIDGSHNYEDVKRDFLLWKSHLIPSGIVVFHDSLGKEVDRVIIEELFTDKGFGKFKFVPCCILYAVKSDTRWYDNGSRAFFHILFRLSAAFKGNRIVNLLWNKFIQMIGKM